MEKIKPIPIGVEFYKEMIDKGYYYVDKTLLIRDLLELLYVKLDRSVFCFVDSFISFIKLFDILATKYMPFSSNFCIKATLAKPLS